MEDKFYGNLKQVTSLSDGDLHTEEIRNQGFTVLENVIDKSSLVLFREKIDYVYEIQKKHFGEDRLCLIKESNICRMPLKYDDYFINSISNIYVLDIIEKLLGRFFILNLQNAIINKPNEENHQRSWHRDLPYQNYIISTPLAINALFCIDDFSKETGGTTVVPYTHKMDVLPSNQYIEKNSMLVEAKAGSVIMFDSMLFHRAGYNSSKKTRRGINHMFTVPIMKQFYDFPNALKGRFSEQPNLSQLLGYTSQVPKDDVEWRNSRLLKDD